MAAKLTHKGTLEVISATTKVMCSALEDVTTAEDVIAILKEIPKVYTNFAEAMKKHEGDN